MTHRADQILEAVADAIRSVVDSTVNVYVHRRDSLSDGESELPAISVDYGTDDAIGDGEDAFLLDGTIESLLTVNLTAAAVATDSPELRRKLLELRTLGHRGIRRQVQLLPFVKGTHYGGANEPDVNTEGEQIVGELTSPWFVRYEMDPDNPE